MTFSILICTYNGAERLPATLRHLAALEQPEGLTAELLMVNNASTDATDAVVQAAWQQSGTPFPLTLLQMPTPGKSHALALGIHRATGENIIICDDDNWLAPDYLVEAQAFFAEHPRAGIAGGLPQAVADGALPDWFEPYSWAYACGPQVPVPGATTGNKPIWGAGMVLRGALAKAVFAPQAPFMLTCRKGEQLLSGGDDEICFRAWLLGRESWYVPALRLQHYMPPARLQPAYRDRLLAGFAHQATAIGAYRRLYQLLTGPRGPFMNRLQKSAGWVFYRLTGRKSQAAHAADYLYFLTRHPRWQTDANKAVWDFYAAAGMPLGRL